MGDTHSAATLKLYTTSAAAANQNSPNRSIANSCIDKPFYKSFVVGKKYKTAIEGISDNKRTINNSADVTVLTTGSATGPTAASISLLGETEAAIFNKDLYRTGQQQIHWWEQQQEQQRNSKATINHEKSLECNREQWICHSYYQNQQALHPQSSQNVFNPSYPSYINQEEKASYKVLVSDKTKFQQSHTKNIEDQTAETNSSWFKNQSYFYPNEGYKQIPSTAEGETETEGTGVKGAEETEQNVFLSHYFRASSPSAVALSPHYNINNVTGKTNIKEFVLLPSSEYRTFKSNYIFNNSAEPHKIGFFAVSSNRENTCNNNNKNLYQQHQMNYSNNNDPNSNMSRNSNNNICIQSNATKNNHNNIEDITNNNKFSRSFLHLNRHEDKNKKTSYCSFSKCFDDFHPQYDLEHKELLKEMSKRGSHCFNCHKSLICNNFTVVHPLWPQDLICHKCASESPRCLVCERPSEGKNNP